MKKGHSVSQILRFLRIKKSAFWERERERRALELFRSSAKNVPAYRDFLKKNQINPLAIKTFKDFQNVPSMSKKEYLRRYPLRQLVWDGTLRKPMVFTSTSGSTGAPFYFPRERKLDWQSSVIHEFFLNNSSHGRNGSTLVIVGFGMGAWIGGLITYKAFEIANERGAEVAIITPGINKKEIFHALRDLASQFGQVILVGYPPFVKDIIDEAPLYGVNLKKLNLRLLFAAEFFSETFRDHLVKKAGIRNIYRDTMNIYGTADIGTTAHETPIAIFIRRLAIRHKSFFAALFPDVGRTPTLAQYNPFFITIEAVDQNILFTGGNTIPLVRYAIGDRGGVMSFDEVIRRAKHCGIDLKREARKAGLAAHITELPFVYIYERTDLSTKLYGAIIYPEPIREALQARGLMARCTGKFTMATRFDAHENQFLEINVEMKIGVSKSKKLEDQCVREIMKQLIARNAEYRNNHSSIPQKVVPRVRLWPYGSRNYFGGSGKQRWVEKL